MWRYQNTDELYHFGVPGMKWGRRRAMRQQLKVLKRDRNTALINADKKMLEQTNKFGKEMMNAKKQYKYTKKKNKLEYRDLRKKMDNEYLNTILKNNSNEINNIRSSYKQKKKELENPYKKPQTKTIKNTTKQTVQKQTVQKQTVQKQTVQKRKKRRKPSDLQQIYKEQEEWLRKKNKQLNTVKYLAGVQHPLYTPWV